MFGIDIWPKRKDTWLEMRVACKPSADSPLDFFSLSTGVEQARSHGFALRGWKLRHRGPMFQVIDPSVRLGEAQHDRIGNLLAI